jgi:hypothetical protein
MFYLAQFGFDIDNERFYFNSPSSANGQSSSLFQFSKFLFSDSLDRLFEASNSCFSYSYCKSSLCLSEVVLVKKDPIVGKFIRFFV